MTENTAPRGNGAGSADTNGRNRNGSDPYTVDAVSPAAVQRYSPDEAKLDTLARAVPVHMVADALGAEPGDEIAPYLDEAQWEALRTWGRQHSIGIAAPNAIMERDGTRFEELEAIPAILAAVISPDLDGITREQVTKFIATATLYDDISDPEAVLKALTDQAEARKRERSQQQQVLKKVSVPPYTAYSLAEIERVCGIAAADAARRMIEQLNRDTWNMGAAARKHRREEHTYLVTAAELVGPKLAVPVESVKALRPANAEERSAAWADLADARALHKSGGTAAQNPVNRRWRTLDDLDNLPCSAWLVEKLLPAAALVHLIGMSQSLKSFMALDMALSLATGTPFAGSARFGVAEPVPVLYVVGEGARGISKRVRAWCQQRGIDRRRVLANFTVLEGAAQLGSQRDMDDVLSKVIETGAQLVVFDTQARCTVGLEENSATDQGRAVAQLDTLMRRTGAAVLVLHHTTKADPRNARGSVAWLNAVDVQLIALRESPTAMEVTVEVGKMKDDAVEGPYRLRAAKVALPVGDDSLVLGPGADPYAADPDLPMDKWTGKGAAYVKQIYALAQENCIPGEGLTQTRLAEIANDVVGEERTPQGTTRKVRRVCSKHPATAAVKLLVEHQKLVESKRDPLGHVFYEPVDYPPPDPAAISALTGDGSGDTGTAPAA
ncbi:AAA family ATPase [Mycobacterium sp. IDR2000157661]|uniref:AAA family ATPase n=1 Tax=Mycobacterium sp. IDR2000157661 TaxID=2867005 RepID=UPI001EEA8DD5|nr:AAA family ATPase [Mycobacterium sp. IDR2000157661]ULE33346.1 helicase RepA family protein [Mycobacterium sp. IDR2000157661]